MEKSTKNIYDKLIPEQIDIIRTKRILTDNKKIKISDPDYKDHIVRLTLKEKKQQIKKEHKKEKKELKLRKEKEKRELQAQKERAGYQQAEINLRIGFK